jgi:5-formyltetrahydrofolate cyclo-ligase
VPLLAFDASGHRLGYGGGFYDRTLEKLAIPAIGIAYAGQEVASLPHEPHDMALSAILTERGLRRFS